MKKETEKNTEYDFALLVAGVLELSSKVADAFFEAGCDDATLSLQHGTLHVEFSRSAPSLADAILSAIRDIRKTGIGAVVLRVDACNLVTPAEIARRIGRTRQSVFQYITGVRGPGGFPPPEYHLAKGTPLWSWTLVSEWLAANNIIRPEESRHAEVISVINNWLESARQRERDPKLVKQVERQLVA